MKTRLSMTAAAIALIGLAGCAPSSDPATTVTEAVEALPQISPGRSLAAQLLDDEYTSSADIEFGTDAFTALAETLPGETSFSFGGITENANGATVVQNFTFTVMIEDIEIGLKAETAEFWGFDSEALTARIEGTNLDESVLLADRITLTNISSVGFDAMSERMAQEYNDALATGLDPSGGIITPSDMMIIRDYDITADKLVFDNLKLEPFTVIYADEDGMTQEDISGIHLLQSFAAASRAFSMKGMAMENTAFVFDMATGDQDMMVNMTAPIMVLSNYERGDLEYMSYYDSKFVMDGVFPVDPTGADDTVLDIAMTGGIKTYEVSALNLGNVYRAVSEWQLPEHTESDFMSLGAWRIQDYQFGIDGETVFNIDSFDMDLTSFHWLLPTDIRIDLDGFRYELGTLFDSILDVMPEDEISGDELEQVQKVMTVLAENGLDCFCGDYRLNAAWDETTGKISYDETGTFAELFESSLALDASITTPEQTAAAISEAVDEAVFEEQLKDAAEFRSFVWQLKDTGGLQALATAAHEIGETFPDEPSMAMLAYNDADALRAFASNAVRGFGPEAVREVPEASSWVEALALWLEDGGTLTLKAAPPRPVNANMIEAYEDREPTPSEMIDIFGLSVTHSPS